MADQHPTPSPELRCQWLHNDHFPMVTGTNDLLTITRDRLNSVMDQAAQWGADQELEACSEWLKSEGHEHEHEALVAARRPKPPSLREQALAALSEMSIEPCVIHGVDVNASVRAKYDIIRRALEALPND